MLDVEDLHGNTALVHATRAKNVEVAAYLVTKGAKVKTAAELKASKGELGRLFTQYLPMLIENASSSLLFAASQKVKSQSNRGININIIRGANRKLSPLKSC